MQCVSPSLMSIKIKCADIMVFIPPLRHRDTLEKMKNITKVTMLPLLLISLAILPNVLTVDTFENYVRRNIPNGFTMSAFVETCEGCGVLYGKDFTYKCLADKTLITFKGCFIAVHDKR